MKNPHLNTLVETIAKRHGLNPNVIKAQITVESSWNTWATRYEPGWIYFKDVEKHAAMCHITTSTERIMQMCSWGLMQVMGGVARELGLTDALPTICTPEVGIDLGCLKMKLLLEKHIELPLALAAYNTGKPRTPAGTAYATKVLKNVAG